MVSLKLANDPAVPLTRLTPCGLAESVAFAEVFIRDLLIVRVGGGLVVRQDVAEILDGGRIDAAVAQVRGDSDGGCWQFRGG